MTDFTYVCFNDGMSKEKAQTRVCLLAVKVTVAEKKKITEYAAKQCVNVSALVRKLLFDKLQKGSPLY